jgi:DNA-directed RNA polymerase specialized sigma24 family protein
VTGIPTATGGQGLSKFSDPQVNCPERTQNWGYPLEAAASEPLRHAKLWPAVHRQGLQRVHSDLRHDARPNLAVLPAIERKDRALAQIAQLLVAREEQERVRQLLSALDPRQAELLVLRSNGLSYEELASTLNLNPASIGTFLSRAQQAFRKEYVQHYGEERYGKE